MQVTRMVSDYAFKFVPASDGEMHVRVIESADKLSQELSQNYNRAIRIIKSCKCRQELSPNYN